MIRNFSFRQRLHLLLELLYGECEDRMRHEIQCSMLLSLRGQMCLLSSVELLCLEWRNDAAQTKTSRHKQKLISQRKCIFRRAVTQPLEIWRNLWNSMTTLRWEKKTRLAKKALFGITLFRGFEYKEIVLLLLKNYNIQMSLSTLKRRIKGYGLRRQRPEYNIDEVRAFIQTIINGHGSLQGYRSVWHTLQLRGIRIPRVVVQELLREMDPEGTELRTGHRLRRQIYHNPGPNYSWHCDGYDKLKPFGFPIHGCIDGWSRKIIWLYVTRSNNQPNNVAAYFLDAVQEYGGCPVDLVTDLGTENGIMAAIQSFFRDDPDSHMYRHLQINA